MLVNWTAEPIIFFRSNMLKVFIYTISHHQTLSLLSIVLDTKQTSTLFLSVYDLGINNSLVKKIELVKL